jgi:phosphohistidine phosphatase
MLTLSLLRHAKSSWDDPSLEDFDRPLAKRGIAAADRMGAYIQAQGLAPDAILCSSAVRARQTLELVLPHFLGPPTVEYDRSLYLASAPVMLARLRRRDAKLTRHVMLVGHDPGMHALACQLASTGNPEQLRAMAHKFPTAGLAVIRFKARAWSKLAAGAGELDRFVTPKTLD